MSFLTRMKDARLVRVVVVYLGASWVVVEASDVLQSALGLPEWLVPVTIVLLLVGLVVVASTAWVQSSPTTDRREAAGEVPGDWQLDLGDAVRSVRGGRLPHLTWGRALAGGAVAFAVLAGAVGLVVAVRSDRGLGPAELSAAAAPGVAVLPFGVSGGDMELWREGMVDLLSRNLDGLGAIRAIDSRTVLARWKETVRSGETPDLATTLAAAARTEARWAVVGSAVRVGPRIRVSADIHEVETGRRLARVAAEGSPDSLLAMVDALSVDVARALLERDDPDVTRLRLASITTSSPDALRAFLEGEASYRRAGFEAAIAAYERAVSLDPTFALAHYRLGSALGWVGRPGGAPARRSAYEHRDRLPAREALLVEAEYRARAGALPSGVALLRQGVQRYPDDAEMWYQLGDIYVHFGPQLLATPSEAERALERAVELDPGFAPYHIHLVDLALLRGDSVEADRRLESERAVARPGTREVEAHGLLFDYLYGPPAARERVVAALDTVHPQVRQWMRTPFALEGEKIGDALTLAAHACEDVLASRDAAGGQRYICMRSLLAGGRIGRALASAATMQGQGAEAIPAMVGLALRQTGADPSAPPGDLDAALTMPAGPDGLVSPGAFVAGVLSVEQERWTVTDSVVRLLHREAAQRDSRGDTLDARLIRGLAEGVEGYRALARGEAAVALRRLEASRDLLAGSVGPEGSFRTFVVWPLAELYARNGRHAEARRLYEALWEGYHGAPALLRAADMSERLGEPERAAELRRLFLNAWAGADPDHPMVRETRRRLLPD